MEDTVFFDGLPSPIPAKTSEDEADRTDTQEQRAVPLEELPINQYRRAAEPQGWRRNVHEEQGRPSVGRSRIYSSLLDRVLDNSDRRQYGMGWVGRIFG